MKKIVPKNAMLIPKDAKRVFEGEIFDVYQWPQKQFDGSSVTYEMLKRPDTVQIVCVDGGQIIAMDERQAGRPSYLRLAGGRVEPDEDWLTAAKRESLEELGLSFANWRLIHVAQPVVKIDWFVATYLAEGVTKSQAAQPEAGEDIKVLKLSFDELKKRLHQEQNPLVDYARRIFDQASSLEDLLKFPEFAGREVEV